MAYIDPQVQLDQQQDARADRNYAAIGDAAINGLKFIEENRQRAIALKRQLDKDTQDQELYKMNKTKLEDEAKERSLPVEETREYKMRSGIEALKQQNKGSSLSDFEKKEQIRAKYRTDKDANAIDNVAQKKIVENNVTLANVKGAMDEALTILNDPNVPEDQKVKTGQGLYKLLNSAEGADAVGAEEAKRLGSYLEYNVLNFTQPGAMFGRDLKGFTDQVKNYSGLLGGRISRNETTAKGLKEGKSFTELTSGQAPAQPQRNPSQISPEDQAAIQWAQSNPKDPRAAKILQLHGAK